jgi:Domain of unknown function (DUF4412)
MKTTRRTLPLLLTLSALAAFAAPSFAGIHYQAVTTQEGTGPTSRHAGERGPTGPTKVESWVSGDKARVEFKEGGGNPMTKSGSYLITKDGGKTLYLVNPEDKTYAKWDLSAMLGAVGGVMNGMGAFLKIEFTDPKVEKLAEEDGGTVAGLPTRHYKFRTSYSTKVKVFGLANSSDVTSDQDIWATTKLTDGAMKVWLRAEPPRTGNEQFDKLISAEMEKHRVAGFPLKTVTVTTSTGKKGTTTRKSTMEVTLLETKPVADSKFEIPGDYKETEMQVPAGERGERGDS